MKNHQIKQALDKIAPLSTQAEWDNSGMQLCFGPKDVKRILVALEITDELIDEAVSKKVQMIVTHHPLIFEPIKSIHCCDPRGRYIQRLIKEEIAVYSSHTPFDIAKGGNTDYLMKLLGIKSVKTVPGTDGFLKLGSITKAVKLSEFVYTISEKLNIDGIKFVGDPECMIKTVACCTGAGADFWYEAGKLADVLVTGDLTHHNAQYALDSKLSVIDAGHWGTEQFFVPNMSEKLSKELGSAVTVIQAETNQNPFSFML